ncbi:hypothetical protein X802_09205 [Thermococcus guaymasensis DSM 11113]|uniref:Uncharacterized protein n=1 Tax=Thermococcus guaymasensis DSM 11113 TaxID=1432656 RepID=A0A0X1KNL2_9EURY|nr:hypothetical protein [Thermococcus guaymasensis]AJC72816.1 hypothetical protein X802_09205 [Thermococcus guaymasensis DSM 11113]
MKKDVYQMVAIAMISFGLLVNFVPAASYYLNTYIHVPYKGNIIKNSTFSYYAFVGSFRDNKSMEDYDLGMIINITYLGNSRYQVKYALYKLLPDGGKDGINLDILPKFPFYATGGVVSISKGQRTLTSEDRLIKLLFPSNPPYGCLLNNTTHTYPNRFYGFPKVIICTSNPNHSIYAIYGNSRLVAINIMPKNMSLLTSIVTLPKTTSSPVIAIYLGKGNTVPPQDWEGWVRYGFGISFPLNVGFVILGILLLIVASRRG